MTGQLYKEVRELSGSADPFANGYRAWLQAYNEYRALNADINTVPFKVDRIEVVYNSDSDLYDWNVRVSRDLNG